MSAANYLNANGRVLSTSSSPTVASKTIWGALPGQTTSAVGGGHTLYGDNSDDNFVIFSTTDKIVLPVNYGDYTITNRTWVSTYTLQAGIQNLIMNGDKQVATGNELDNLIITQDGSTTVSGGGGNDVFVVGTGAAIIVDAQGSGSDAIYGFKHGTDHVRLDGSTQFANWTSVRTALKQTANDVQLDMGNGQILIFCNDQLSNFSSDNFYLPINAPSLPMTFDDEFSSFVSSPDGSKGWMTSWPYGGINDRSLPSDSEYVSDSSVGVNPFSVKSGILDITATKAAPGSNPLNLPYNSGVITTYKSFSQLYGYFEVRAELPTGKGLWPSFYMMSADDRAELDVFEVLGISPTTLYATATQHVIGGAPISTTTSLIVPDTSTDFHTFGMDWEPTTITFYMDGHVIATAPTPASANKPMYMIVGFGMGVSGGWAGAPDSSTPFPATLQVDYVRAYATAATVDVSGPAAILLNPTASKTLGSISGQALLAGVGDSGATVSLLNAAGSILANAAPNSAGKFTFGSLAAGSYQIKYTAPSGQVLQTGSAANPATGLMPPVMLAAGQALTLPTQAFLSNPATIQSNVLHFGGSADPAWGTGEAGIAVSLQDSSGTVVATTASDVSGWFFFRQLAAGTYRLHYNPLPGESIKSGSLINQTTGLTSAFTVAAGQTVIAPSGAMVAATPPVTLGSGPDSIVVGLSEDSWLGDAQFTASVDGKQIGGIQTATALHRDGQTRLYALNGSFGAGAHAVGINFLNDAYGGTPTTDRNLYVDSITANGTTTVLNAAQLGNGMQLYDAAPPAPGFSGVTLGSGASSITVGISEDAYLGNAQFTLGVDGKQIGGTQTAAALHGYGQSQSFTLNGAFGSGPHSVTATFLNDAYAGTAATDRNLYIDSVTAGGATRVVNATLLANGSVNVAVTLPIAATTTVTLAANSPTTLAFINASGAVPLDAGTGATPLSLTGSNSSTLFILHAGAANGDVITNFKTGSSVGDFLELTGYGAGPTLTQVNATTWQAASGSGAIHDLIHLSNGAMLTPANTLFG